MNPHHLCVVTETYFPEVNGVAISLQRLLQSLNPNVFRVSMVRTRPKPKKSGASAQAKTDVPLASSNASSQVGELKAGELQVRGIRVPQYPDVQLGLPAGSALQRAWENDRPALVYVATEGPLGASAVAMARKMNIPVISAFHTNFHRYSGYYGVGWIQSLVMAWMRRFHNRTALTLVPSRTLVQELTSAGLQRVEWLPHGVDCEHFHPARRSVRLREAWGIQGREVVALMVGRLAAEKNLVTALSAVQSARRAGHRIRSVVVGDGPMRAALERQFPEAIFCGEQTGVALAAHYASADVFLMPSQTETFGLVTLEAMASGLPVVAYDLAAAGEFVRPGVDGMLASDLSEQAFNDALCGLLSLEPTFMGLDARAQAEQLSWPSVARQFERRTLALLANQYDCQQVVQPLQNPL
ncbi:MAG: glycosyltransferase family 1 protein [Pseudomonadota bacterium]|nr:glycosyltransferase family 1 protein [Pseudomonadota bacterium]